MRTPVWILDNRKLVALTFSGLAAASAIAMAIGERNANNRPVAAARQAVAGCDPFAAEFTRCQALGDAGARDPGCLAAWAESRRRFLRPGPSSAERPSAPKIRPQVARPEDE